MDKDRIDRVKQIQRSDCLQFLDFDLKYNIDTFGPVEQSKDGLNQTKPASVDRSPPTAERIHRSGPDFGGAGIDHPCQFEVA